MLVQYTADLYDAEFFVTIAPAARRAAEVVVPRLITQLQPESVIDLGCATGEWLAVFRRHGVFVTGIDLPSVPVELRAIPPQCFQPWDVVAAGFPPVDRQYDLALCLETAEHLPADCADGLVDWLTSVAQAVCFSAAVPQQNGVGHINEQPHTFWLNLFKDRQFVPVASTIALTGNDPQVASYYRNNIFLFRRNS